MKKKFEVGDIVRLKSGGPAMTVTHIHMDGELNASWFVKCEVKHGRFVAATLQPYNESKKDHYPHNKRTKKQS